MRSKGQWFATGRRVTNAQINQGFALANQEIVLRVDVKKNVGKCRGGVIETVVEEEIQAADLLQSLERRSA